MKYCHNLKKLHYFSKLKDVGAREVWLGGKRVILLDDLVQLKANEGLLRPSVPPQIASSVSPTHFPSVVSVDHHISTIAATTSR